MEFLQLVKLLPQKIESSSYTGMHVLCKARALPWAAGLIRAEACIWFSATQVCVLVCQIATFHHNHHQCILLALIHKIMLPCIQLSIQLQFSVLCFITLHKSAFTHHIRAVHRFFTCMQNVIWSVLLLYCCCTSAFTVPFNLFLALYL
jgi:hypothetical protein